MEINPNLPFTEGDNFIECLDHGRLAFRTAIAERLAHTIANELESQMGAMLQVFEKDFVSHLLNCTDVIEGDHDEVLMVECEEADAAKQMLDAAVSCFLLTLKRVGGQAYGCAIGTDSDAEKAV